LKHLFGDRKVAIGVLGCMATNFKEKLINDPQLPIDFIVGPDSYKNLADILNAVEQKGDKVYDVTLSEFETYADVYPLRKNGVNAWLAVMRGCNNFCSFCVVPHTRGKERSRPPLNILDEVKKLASEGFRQVTLLGQNVNSYKFDDNDFAGLLEMIGEIDGIERIRFTSPNPKDFPQSLLRVVAENPKVCKHIHLPLQSGNSRILDLMRRTYTKEDYLNLVDEIRQSNPLMTLTTDVIVGFPTETDQEFEDTVYVMKQVEFDSAFIFKYSERDGTIAKRKYADDVPEERKTERIIRLNKLQKEISLKKNRSHIGQVQKVLIEEEKTKKSLDEVQGRNDGNKVVILPEKKLRIGQFVSTRITDASANTLKGEMENLISK